MLHSFSGVRPLFDDGKGNPSAVTRDYVFDLDETAAHRCSMSLAARSRRSANSPNAVSTVSSRLPEHGRRLDADGPASPAICRMLIMKPSPTSSRRLSVDAESWSITTAASTGHARKASLPGNSLHALGRHFGGSSTRPRHAISSRRNGRRRPKTSFTVARNTICT